MTKEEIELKYNDLKKKLGKKPSLKEFKQQSGVSDRILAKIYGRNAFTQLVTECGDSPRHFFRERTELKKILSNWGKLTRKIEMIPTTNEWAQSGNKPSASAIRRSHNLKWTEIPFKFHEVYGKETEWQDVLALLDFQKERNIIIELTETECYVYLMLNIQNNRHKIGISSEPYFREKTLQSAEPKIEMIAKKKYVNRKIAGAIEKALHNVYQHKRVRGEWFILDNEDIKELILTLND